MSYDLFRAPIRDLTRSAAAGPVLSVSATLLMAALFWMETQAYLTTTVVTDVAMDDQADGSQLVINFDMTMPELVCQYASVDVSDTVFGTEKQHVTKDIRLQRMDARNRVIGEVSYDDASSKLKYETLGGDDDDEGAADKKGTEHCAVTLHGGKELDGWQAVFEHGSYDAGALQEKGAKNDATNSMFVAKGCMATLFENGDMAGWQATFGPGEYKSEALVQAGARLDDASSLIVVEGSGDDAKNELHEQQEIHSGEVISLDKNSFDEFVKDSEHKMVVVDFFAPWCHWCQILEPVWKRTAKDLPNQPYAEGTRMCKVDCEENGPLCEQHHVRAYPTINVYKTQSVQAENTYYGDRTSVAFHAWLSKEYMIIDMESSLEKLKTHEQQLLHEAHALAGKKATGDALHLGLKGKREKEGCHIEGIVLAKRVPGNFHVNFVHGSYEFKNHLINATHRVEHLSFGAPVREDLLPRMEWMDKQMRHYYAKSNTLDASTFVSRHADRTYEHFIQIVPTTYHFASGEWVRTFKYTVTSSEHSNPDKYPSAKFSFQISPMAVVMSEKTQPLYQFLTNVCAIVGGLFTVFSLLNATLDTALRAVKDSLGKEQ